MSKTLVVFFILAMGLFVGKVISPVEYRVLDNSDKQCLSIETSDVGTVYMCDK